MNKIAIAWLVGILICLGLWSVDMKVHVADPIIIQSDDVQSLNLDKVVRDNLPQISLPSGEASGPNWFKIIQTVGVLGLVLVYTRSLKKED